jgi:hypothetical protein
VAGDSDYVIATNATKKNVNVTMCYYGSTIHRGPFKVSDERVQIDAAFWDDIRIQWKSTCKSIIWPYIGNLEESKL